jgi:hypothetical protein
MGDDPAYARVFTRLIVDVLCNVNDNVPYTLGDAGGILHANVAYRYPEEGIDE